jgi:hypothetical protein
MKGGRLKIVNDSRYDTAEVEALVRFGLDEIELTGERIVAAVKNTQGSKRREAGAPAYSGTAYSLRGGIPSSLYDRYCGRRTTTHHLIVMRLGPPEAFPVGGDDFRRYAGVDKGWFHDWREGLVAITAHEGMHAQHVHDGAYRAKSGRRKPATAHGRPYARGARVRVGGERIEAKCEAFEAYMLRRYRAERIDPGGALLLPSPEQTAMAREGGA